MDILELAALLTLYRAKADVAVDVYFTVDGRVVLTYHRPLADEVVYFDTPGKFILYLREQTGLINL